MSTYKDGRLECNETELRVKGYYPWGAKRIPYTSITSVQRFTMSALRGKGRIWGSGDLRHWANFDPQRPRKSIGFYLTVGGPITPFVTPDDPEAFEQALRSHVPAAFSD